MSQTTLFADEGKSQRFVPEVDPSTLILSRFNPRKTRPGADVDRLAERMRRNGYELTRALWVHDEGGQLAVFAGGTRLEAAKRAGVQVAVVIFEGYTLEEIARKADEDNENDEYHTPVSPLDTWAEYARLADEEGWTQQRIADAKGVGVPVVSRRIKWHRELPEVARKAICDGVLDEGHIEAVSGVTCDVATLHPWLTTEAAQTELTREVLSKHRGSSEGRKPTVANVRDHARRWKEMIALAESLYGKLEGEWAEQFVQGLAESKARTLAAVQQAYSRVTRAREEAARREEEELAARASAAEAERIRLERERERQEYVAGMIARVVHGDAREFIQAVPKGFHLLLTDPPYGMNFQSGRRVTSARKDAIVGDDQTAADLLLDVLVEAYERMAEDATVLVFTGWRGEPEFRTVIEEAGFEVRGSLVWVKHNHGTGDLTGAFAPKHERIIHATKGHPALNRRHPDVLNARDRQNSEHPTEKPVELLAQLIEATTTEGQIVVDPFAGSGSTIFAAHDLGREFYGCEIDEGWHSGIVDRLYTVLTGRQEAA